MKKNKDPKIKLCARLGLTLKRYLNNRDSVMTQYKYLAKKYHPDRCQNKKSATRKFQRIQEAKEILTDPVKLEEYISQCPPKLSTKKYWTRKFYFKKCKCHTPQATLNPTHILLHCPILNGARKLFCQAINSSPNSLSLDQILLTYDLSKIHIDAINNHAHALYRFIQAAKLALNIEFI